MGLRGGGDRVIVHVSLGLLAVLVAIVAAVAWALAATPAEAQARCGLRERVVDLLTDKFRERQIGAGLQGANIAELWVSDETGTWTMLLTLPSGVSCLIGSGASWSEGSRPAEGEAM